MVKCWCVGSKHNQFNNEDYKIKENKIMGLGCKETGKFQSMMRKMENQLEAERKVAKEKREAKKK